MQKQIVHHNLVTEHLLFHPLFRTNSIKQCHLQFYGTYFPLLIFSMETVWQTHFPKDKEHYWNLQISSTAHGGKSPQIPSYQMPCHSCRLIIGRTNLKDTPLNPGPKNLPRANEDNNGRGEHERDGSQTNEYWQRFASKSLQIDPTLVGKNNKKKNPAKTTDRVLPSKATNPTDPTTMIRTREGDGRVYLSPDPPRLLATGRRRRVGREETISSGSTAEEPKQNETKREGIEKRGPKTYLASPRLVSARTKQQFFFLCVRVRICSPDRWERKGREAPTSRRVKGQRRPVPRVGGSGKPRAVPVPWLSWKPTKCPAGDVICVTQGQVGRFARPTRKGLHRARAWAGSLELWCSCVQIQLLFFFKEKIYWSFYLYFWFITRNN
jgi:hypothetical protein